MPFKNTCCQNDQSHTYHGSWSTTKYFPGERTISFPENWDPVPGTSMIRTRTKQGNFLLKVQELWVPTVRLESGWCQEPCRQEAKEEGCPLPSLQRAEEPGPGVADRNLTLWTDDIMWKETVNYLSVELILSPTHSIDDQPQDVRCLQCWEGYCKVDFTTDYKIHTSKW